MSALNLLFQTVAITGGTIHTLEPGAAPIQGTVLVENGYIRAIGADVDVPAGAETVDARGKFVLPGLIDGFVNLDPDHDLLYVSEGVTLVRDTGNEHTRILAETARDARDRSPGPWIWCAGAVLDGSPPATRSVVLLDGLADVEGKLPRLFEDEVDFLSFQSRLTRDPWRRVIELAHAAHKQVWGPLPQGVGIEDVLASGQDGVYHLDAFLAPGSTWSGLTDERIEEIATRAGARGLAVTPTLAFYAKRLVKPTDAPDRFAHLSPYYEAVWERDRAQRERSLTLEFLAEGTEIVRKQGRLVRSLVAHGCRLVPGSGAPNPWLAPGEALLDELSLLRAAGFSSDEIVRMATSGAAEALGIEKRGTLRVGKVGDVLVTARDPLEDIGNLHRPDVVVLRGEVLARAELDRRVEKLAQAQAQVRERLAKPLVVAPPEVPPGDVVMEGSVETRGLGVRVSAERWAIVRRYDGSLTYCGRLLVPGEATIASTETSVQQTIQNGDLVEFDLKIETAGRRIEMHGAIVAGKMSLERRLNGQFVRNDLVKERLGFLDCGSVTGLLVLGYQRQPGVFRVMFLDDFEPAIGNWELRLDKQAVHLVQTPLGALTVAYDASGAIAEAKREIGSGIVQTLPLETKVLDKKGLPMPAAKRDAAPK